MERHGAHSHLSLCPVFHWSALGLKHVTRGDLWEVFGNWRFLLEVVVVRAFDLGGPANLPEFFLLLADVINHGLVTVLFFLFLTVLLLFLFETGHVPGLCTLRDNLRGRSLPDDLNLGHRLDIHLLIHDVSLVEYVLRGGHRVIDGGTSYHPWRLLLIWHNLLLLLLWRRRAPSYVGLRPLISPDVDLSRDDLWRRRVVLDLSGRRMSAHLWWHRLWH